MRIVLPEKVRTIIHTLQEHGYEAYAVGGCVRDSVLGRTPDDWDITTSALPEETKALFARTFDTGIEHGTVTVLLDKEGFEVTTYRMDGEYEDNRHPKEVTFTRNLREDLLRRDFTINAMAYNETDGLVDIFGGMDDLEQGIIRCVGNARERFTEDALRILRAVRFAAQLGFEIEEHTGQAVRELCTNLQYISAERIQTELVKLLVSPHPELLKTAYELGVTAVFLPEFDAMIQTTQETPHHDLTVGEHTIKAVCQAPPDKILRLTMLLHDMGKPIVKTFDTDHRAHFKMHDAQSTVMAREILRRLKFDNDTTHKVVRLVQYHDMRIPDTPKSVRRAVNQIGEDLFPYFLQVQMADTLAQSMYKREEKLRNLEGIRRCYEAVLEQKDCVSLKRLAVRGDDLIRQGMKPGKEIGTVLNRLLDAVLEHPEYNTKEKLLDLFREM